MALSGVRRGLYWMPIHRMDESLPFSRQGAVRLSGTKCERGEYMARGSAHAYCGHEVDGATQAEFALARRCECDSVFRVDRFDSALCPQPTECCVDPVGELIVGLANADRHVPDEIPLRLIRRQD